MRIHQLPGLSLGAFQALLCSVPTAKGTIFLLKSTHPPPLTAAFGLPNLGHGQKPHLLPRLHPSRPTS